MKALFERAAKCFRRSSLQVMLTVSFTCITALALLAFGLSYHVRSTDLTRDRIGEDNIRIVGQVNYSFDSYLRSMMRVSDTMYYTVIKNTDLDQSSLTEEMNLLYEANHDQLISIAVFDSAGRLQAAVPQSTVKPGLDPAEQRWFTDALGRIENFHFSQPHVQNLFLSPDETHHWVVSLSRAVELTRSGQSEQGVLLVDMDFSGLEQICSSSGLGENGYLYIVDNAGDIIYHPNQQLIHAGLYAENNLAAAFYEEGNHVEDFGGEERMVTVKAIGYTGWKLVGVMPMSDIESAFAPNWVFPVLIILLIILLMGAANTFLSSRIAVPIKNLESAVNVIEEGDLTTPIPIGGSYEVRRLGGAIRSMAAQLRRLMDDIVREQEQKRRNELEVLQSQINPHFLYNTLDSIIWMIENEEYSDAISMVTSLARLFRISLSKGRNVITLGSELDHARSYLTIQQMRYKDKFIVRDQSDPALNELACLKLIVQPLLENAIYHGLEFMVDGEGELTIRTAREEEDLIIEVSDNGPGIPYALQQQLLTPDFEKNSKTGGRARKGYGLYNVHERIRLTYGVPYGLTILSEPDCGTTVRIRLPALPFDAGQGGETP